MDNSPDSKGRLVKFQPGKVVCTPGVVETFTTAEMRSALHRHLSGDWGEVCPQDKASNDAALRWATRILSAYSWPDAAHHEIRRKLWIITEADRSATMLLLPEEY